MKDEKQITMKNGRPAITGACGVCGTKMFKIGGGGGAAKAKVKAKVKVKKAGGGKKKGKGRRR